MLLKASQTTVPAENLVALYAPREELSSQESVATLYKYRLQPIS